MGDSMAALSHGDDIDPIDGRMPRSRTVLESGGDTRRDPRSLRFTHPSGGFRLARTIFSASSASSAVMFGPIDQPATRRDHMPVASAGYSQPWRVLT